MKTTTELILEIKVYLSEKYITETPQNKEKIMEWIGGLQYIEGIITIMDNFLISFSQLISLGK